MSDIFHRVARLAGPAALFVLAAASAASADERHFTYSYEARTLPKGSWELEQWATIRTGKTDGSFVGLDLREEIEYGITDQLNAAIYLNFGYERTIDVPGRLDSSAFEFRGVSTEWKYKLSDPSADVLGTLAYAELELSEDEIELELKAIASKDVGDFHFAYNLIFEVIWLRSQVVSGNTLDTDYVNRYLLQHAFGVSYQPVSWGAIGAEALIETRFDDEMSREFSALFVGPNLHIAQPAWWATLTFLVQADVFSGGRELDFREKYQVRLIVGFSF